MGFGTISGCKGHQGVLGLLGRLGHQGCRDVRGALGPGRECRHFGQQGYRWHQGEHRGVGDVRGTGAIGV